MCELRRNYSRRVFDEYGLHGVSQSKRAEMELGNDPPPASQASAWLYRRLVANRRRRSHSTYPLPHFQTQILVLVQTSFIFNCASWQGRSCRKV